MAWRRFKTIWIFVVIFLVLYIALKNEHFEILTHRFGRNIVHEVDANGDRTIKRIAKSKSLKKPPIVPKLLKNKLTSLIKNDTQSINPDPTLMFKESCKPNQAVVFIKTHKTGSSTITNILNRFADLNDLKVALPMGDFYRFRWPVPFHWSAVDLWRLDGDTPSILSNHARYNRPTLQLIMTKGSKYITILRNPVKQYESMFNYMEFNKFLQFNLSKNPLADFVKNPVPPLYKMRRKFRGIPETMNLVKNPMFFDLGMYPPAYDNMSRVKKEILKINRDFELVLIMEYFDESLVILKKAFCWQMEDILYVKFNQRRHAQKIRLSDDVMRNIRNWNKADVLLYEFFNKTLWAKIKDYGVSFWKDLNEFRKLNSKTEELCVDKREVSEVAFHLKGEIRSFRLNSQVANYDRYFCQKIIRNEIDYINYFRMKYKPYGSYQNVLEMEGRKKPSTRELIERLQIASNIRFASDSIPRAVT